MGVKIMEMTKKVAHKAVLIYPKFHGYTFWSFERTMAKYIPRNEFGLPKGCLPPLGLMGLFNYLKPYYDDIELIDRNVNQLPLDELIKDADHVYIGGMIAQQEGFLEDARLVKDAGKTLIAGGTIVDEHSPLMTLADHLVENEAEMVIDDLLDGLYHGNAEKLYRGTHTPPERFFQPDYSSVNLENYYSMSVQTSRGCPFDCEFCDITARFGRKPRVAPWEHTESAFRELFQLGWRGSVFIVDDNFIGNPVDTISLLKKIHKLETDMGHRFPKYSEVSMNLSDETPVMSELREWFGKAHFVDNFIGVETNNTEALLETGKRHNLRGELTIQEKLKLISKDTGANMMMGIIYGFDSDTLESAVSLIDFINSTHVPIVMVGLLQALPNTKLWDRMKREGRLITEEQATGNTADGKMNFIPYNISEREAERNCVEIIKRIYSEEAFFARVRRALNVIGRKLDDVPNANARKIYSGLRILVKENSFTYWRYLKEAHKIGKRRFGFGTRGYWHILTEYLVYCARYTHMKAQAQYMEEQIESRDYEQWQTFSWKEFQEFQIFELTMPDLLQERRGISL
jgi:radical SAM superfamily enzyme YgiQ (UPF0313 family)